MHPQHPLLMHHKTVIGWIENFIKGGLLHHNRYSIKDPKTFFRKRITEFSRDSKFLVVIWCSLTKIWKEKVDF